MRILKYQTKPKKRFITIAIKRNKTTLSVSLRFNLAKIKAHKKSKQTKHRLKQNGLQAHNMLLLAVLITSINGLLFTGLPYLDAFAISNQGAQKVATPITTQTKIMPKHDTRVISKPLAIKIPVISLDAKIKETSLNKNGSLLVPDEPNTVGWYKSSSAPGQSGPAVIAGHLDTVSGPAVFANLSTLKIGDDIKIILQNQQIISYKVVSQQQYSQKNFPASKVYANTSESNLILVTCSGVYNYLAGHYTNNLVVTATKV